MTPAERRRRDELGRMIVGGGREPDVLGWPFVIVLGAFLMTVLLAVCGSPRPAPAPARAEVPCLR